MKKKVVIIFIILFVLILLGFIIISLLPKTKISLEEKYYNTNALVEIGVEEYEKLLDEQENFGLLVYQPNCVNSSNLTEIVTKFQGIYGVSFYKIAYSKIKQSSRNEYLKYYPSFIIFNKGKMVDYLDANQDSDTKYFQEYKEFAKWVSNYIIVKENTNYSQIKTTKETTTKLKSVNLEDITREANKVNIYMFWGDGCPHCRDLHEFFTQIQNEYGNLYNLYTFEVWKDEYNASLMHTFGEAMNDEVKGVPYTIIGSKSFKGYNESQKEEIISAIKEESTKNFDIYFDKIKK